MHTPTSAGYATIWSMSTIMDAQAIRTFTVSLSRDEETGAHVAQCVEEPACITQGDSPEQAIEMMRGALSVYLEYATGSEVDPEALHVTAA